MNNLANRINICKMMLGVTYWLSLSQRWILHSLKQRRGLLNLIMIRFLLLVYNCLTWKSRSIKHSFLSQHACLTGSVWNKCFFSCVTRICKLWNRFLCFTWFLVNIVGVCSFLISFFVSILQVVKSIGFICRFIGLQSGLII